MNITVYLGASSGNDPTLETSVRALGRLIGKSGNALVYGGSKSGLMGALAESVLRAGGEVTGVEPQFFIDKGYEYDEITTLIVTRDMAERKTKMIELGDAFIAFPGGTGTLEEISEIMWAPLSRAAELVSFANDKRLLRHAQRRLGLLPTEPEEKPNMEEASE